MEAPGDPLVDLGTRAPWSWKSTERVIVKTFHVVFGCGFLQLATQESDGLVWVATYVLLAVVLFTRAVLGPSAAEQATEWPPKRAWNSPTVIEKKAWAEKGYERKVIVCDRPDGTHVHLFCQKFAPLGGKAPRAVVVFSHGLYSYTGNVMRDILFLRDNGYAVVAPDHEGHGRSSGAHGYFTNIWRMADDFCEAVAWARELYPGKKVFLMGGSMGGLIALEASIKLEDKPDAMVLMCPLICPHGASRPHNLVEVMGRFLLNIAPRLRLTQAHKGKNHHPSRCDEERKRFESNPLNYHGDLQVASAFALKDAFEYIQDHLDDVTVPFLVQHGTKDQAVDIKGSQMLFDRALSKVKEFRQFDAHHALTEEPGGVGAQVHEGWLHFFRKFHK